MTTSLHSGPIPVACQSVGRVPDAEAHGLPADALAHCCREEHGHNGHVGYVGQIRLTWDVIA